MRTISKTGKDIIQLILAQPEGEIDILGAALTGSVFGLDKIGVFLRKEQDSSILVPVNSACAENVRRSKREFVSLLSFLKYLEDEGLIFVIDRSTRDSLFFCDADDPIVGDDGSTQYYTYDKGRIEVEDGIYMAKDRYGSILMLGVSCSPTLSSCMNHFLTGEIYSTESLRVFAEKKIKNLEELQYEKEIKYTKKGLYVSLVALGISLLSPIISIPLSNKYSISTINNDQFRTIDTTLNDINKGIHYTKRHDGLIHKHALMSDSMNVGRR